MKTYTFLLAFTSLSALLSAQVTFEHTHSNGYVISATDILERPDGSYFYAYSNLSGWGNIGFGTLDADGIWLSESTYGTSDGYSMNMNAIQPLANGDYMVFNDSIYCPWIVCISEKKLTRFNTDGEFMSTQLLNLPFNSLYRDHYMNNDETVTLVSTSDVTQSRISTYTANGDSIWSVDYAYPPGQGRIVFNAISPAANGGFMLTGKNPNGTRMLIARTNNLGDTLWLKTYGEINNVYAGIDIETIDETSFIILGDTSGITTPSDIHLTKIDDDGNILWSKLFGGADNDFSASILRLSDGSFVALGTTYSFGAGGSDYYLIKTDSNGNILWTNTFGTEHNEFATSIRETEDGGFIISGNQEVDVFTQNIYIVKTDVMGNTVNIIHHKTIPTIYPNPTNGIIQIQSNKQIIQIEITDMAGHLVMKQFNAHDLTRLDLGKLSDGIYTITTTYNDNMKATSRVVISK
jgi:hypothetical protein